MANTGNKIEEELPIFLSSIFIIKFSIIQIKFSQEVKNYFIMTKYENKFIPYSTKPIHDTIIIKPKKLKKA